MTDCVKLLPSPSYFTIIIFKATVGFLLTLLSLACERRRISGEPEIHLYLHLQPTTSLTLREAK